MPDYPPEQLWPLYEKLPEDLKEAIFSEKTANTIYDVCNRHGLEEEKISEVAKHTGYVMLGLLPLPEFQETLKDELKLKNDLAQKIALEITRFIFFPLKESLEALYKTEIEKPEMPTGKSVLEEKLTEKREKDIYREPIE